MQNSDTLRSKKKRWHFSVEKNFVCDSRISPMARMLYLVLMSYASPTSPVPFPGMRTLSTILQCSDDTIRKYRIELEESNWLEVEQRRDGHQKYLSNAYILLDGPDEDGAIPKKPDTAFSGIGSDRTRPKPDTKRGTSTGEEETISRSEEKTSNSNTAPAATAAAAAAEASPSAPTGAEAPEPPAPASSAESFIQEYRTWGSQSGLSVSVVPRERQAVTDFFSENQKFTVRELVAIMLSAWLMQETVREGTDHDLFWHCRLKSKRIATFIKHLPEICDELDWQGTEKRITKTMRIAQQRLMLKQAA